jgi:hypothetical protein
VPVIPDPNGSRAIGGIHEPGGPDAVLAWATVDPGNVRLLLGVVGFEPETAGTGGALAIPGLRLDVTHAPGPDRLRWAEASGRVEGATAGVTVGAESAPIGADSARGGARLLAVAVAAVDLERAAAALGCTGRDLPDDMLLGARVATTGAAGILVAEPRTEGRLGAALARHGEGPAALYVAIPRGAVGELLARLIGLGERPRDGDGPFGPQVLARTRPAWGPFLLLVPEGPTAGPPVAGRSATIAP